MGLLAHICSGPALVRLCCSLGDDRSHQNKTNKQTKKRPGTQFSPQFYPPTTPHPPGSTATHRQNPRPHGPEPRRGGLLSAESAVSRISIRLQQICDGIMGPTGFPSAPSTGPLSPQIGSALIDLMKLELNISVRNARSTSPRPMSSNLVKRQRNEISGGKVAGADVVNVSVSPLL